MIPSGLSLLSLDLSVLLSSVLPSFSRSTFGQTALELCCVLFLAPVQFLGVHSDWTSLVTCPLWLGLFVAPAGLDGTLFPYY